jgi:putative spermidine/putrescine transport system ATP-binding protein
VRTTVSTTANARASASSTGPPKLHLEGIRFRYGGTDALHGIDLAVHEGEFVSILGPSGCGKTTLLRIVAGLLHPSAGRVYLDGRDITGLPPEKRPLGMVFQHLALFPHLSVRDNVAFGLRLKRVARDEREDRVRTSLALVGLSGFESRSTHQLSGGQRQRVALARSLITEPSILLLDEPLGALDSAIRKDMQAELTALQRRLRITFIFVTHDQAEAMSMSDRVVLMRDGLVVQDATPVQTYLDPVDPFAASFVGETNLMHGEVAENHDGAAIVRVGTVELSVRCDPDLAIADGVIISVRPEQVAFADPDAPEALVGVIVNERFFGHEVLIDVETRAGLVRVRDHVSGATTGRLGATVHLTFDEEHVRVFRADS